MGIAETVSLTQAMVAEGTRLRWPQQRVLDKHCIGGVPGNRTTLIVVPIVAALGLTIPKTSSRAITSPSGTADTMETLAPVALDVASMRKVVEAEGGCIVWGGSVNLSPVDDILIRVERPLDLDSEAQMIASVISKKVAAGSTYALIDIPVGPTAKIRSEAAANTLAAHLVEVGRTLGLDVEVAVTDGTQPVGRGIGPALEARDVLAVLRNEPQAPADLRERALDLAGRILEHAGGAAPGHGAALARAVLDDGRAWRKFQAIALAQGGLREPVVARQCHMIEADAAGTLARIDNRRLARIAKLAGAPRAPGAGVDLLAAVGSRVQAGQPLYAVHAESPGELAYALDYARRQAGVIEMAPT
jgi:thymidine phosphorylase